MQVEAAETMEVKAMEVKAMEEMEEEEAVEEMEEEILEVLVKAKISPSMSKNELLTSRSLLTF